MAVTAVVFTQDDEMEHGKELARRYRCEFVDLKSFHIQHELFRKIKVDLMFRYNFVPLQETQDGRLVIAIADPSELMPLLDEIRGHLGRRIITQVATLSQISDVLKKSEQSQRVLEEAGENFALDVIREDENSDETISIEKLTGETDISPIIRLVDTTIFTALQRRASDIHIETRDDSVVIKYRIDGVLQQAMQPIAKEHHSTIISRIKVMSELDISERRVPQDGRFRVRYNGAFHRLPRLHHAVDSRRRCRAPRARQRVDEREVSQAHARCGRIQRRGSAQVPPLHQGAVWHGAGHWTDRLRQDDDALCCVERDQERRRQADHDRRSGRIPDSRHHADSGERERRA